MDRQLSPNVTSRWYRSPEVILKDKIYSFKSDMIYSSLRYCSIQSSLFVQPELCRSAAS